jgi:hypothetical protein
MSYFKVFVKMYFDDFLLDCKLNGGDVQNKDFNENNSGSKDVMEKYLGKMIAIKVNEKLVTGKLINMYCADNEISMNLEYTTQYKPETVFVRNLIMTGLYSDMSNLIIIKVKNFEEGVKLTSDITEQTFKVK